MMKGKMDGNRGTEGKDIMEKTEKTTIKSPGGLDGAMLVIAALAAFAAPLLFMRNILDHGQIKQLLVSVCALGIFALGAQKLMGAVEKKITLRWTVLDALAAGFLLWSLLTAPGSLNRYESLMAWGSLASYFIIYIYISRAPGSASETALGAIAASGAAAAAYTLVAATIVWRSRINMNGDILYQMKNWLVAPMGGNNFTAAFLALGLPAACGLAAGSSGGRRRLWAICGALQALALAACLSRVAFAAAGLYGVALAVFLIASGRKRAGAAVAGAGVIFVALTGVLFIIWAGGGAKRLTADLLMTRGKQSAQGYTSLTMRQSWWKDAARMGADNLATGTGYGGFQFAHPRYRSLGEETLRPETRLTTPHNDYLHAFAESGAPGAALYAAMLAAGLAAAFGAARKSRGKDPAALAAAGIIATAAVFGLADFTFQMPASRLAIFVALGAAGALALKSPRARSFQTPSIAVAQVTALALLAVFALFTFRQGAAFAAQVHVYKEFRNHDNPNKALEEFLAAMKLDTRARNAHAFAGVIYYNTAAVEPDAAKAAKLYGDSIRMFERALVNDPYDYNAMNFLGVALCKAGRAAEAVEQFNRASEIYPKFANPHRNLGTLWKELGDVEKAKAELSKALQLNPNQPAVYYELAMMEEEYLRFKSAERLLKKALELDPGNETYKKELAKAQRIINLPINR